MLAARSTSRRRPATSQAALEAPTFCRLRTRGLASPSSHATPKIEALPAIAAPAPMAERPPEPTKISAIPGQALPLESSIVPMAAPARVPCPNTESITAWKKTRPQFLHAPIRPSIPTPSQTEKTPPDSRALLAPTTRPPYPAFTTPSAKHTPSKPYLSIREHPMARSGGIYERLMR